MRFSKTLLLGLAVAGLAGCSSASGPSSPGSPSSASSATTKPTAAQTGAVVPNAQAGARAAAGRFDGLYQAGQFGESWDLLIPAAKLQVPAGLWVKVHDACRPTSAGPTGSIKAITVFGTAAIVTEATGPGAAKSGTFEEVFSYANGQWGYSPNDLAIYRHGSAAADIAAAKAAGVCATGKTF